MVNGELRSQEFCKKLTWKSVLLQKGNLEVRTFAKGRPGSQGPKLLHQSSLSSDQALPWLIYWKKKCPAQITTTVCSTPMRSQSQCGHGLKILVRWCWLLGPGYNSGSNLHDLFPKISFLASNQYAPFLSLCTASGSYLLMSGVKVSPMQNKLSQCNMSQYSALFGVW